MSCFLKAVSRTKFLTMRTMLCERCAVQDVGDAKRPQCVTKEDAMART